MGRFSKLDRTTTAGTDRVAEEKSSLTNRPFNKKMKIFLAYYILVIYWHTTAQNYSVFYFLHFFFRVMGTNVIYTARPSTPRSKRPLRRERRDTPSSSIARAATAGYRCRWHRSSGSYSRQSGETARREQRSKRERE